MKTKWQLNKSDCVPLFGAEVLLVRLAGCWSLPPPLSDGGGYVTAVMVVCKPLNVEESVCNNTVASEEECDDVIH